MIHTTLDLTVIPAAGCALATSRTSTARRS